MRLVSNSHLYWEKAQNQVGSKIFGEEKYFLFSPNPSHKTYNDRSLSSRKIVNFFINFSSSFDIYSLRQHCCHIIRLLGGTNGSALADLHESLDLFKVVWAIRLLRGMRCLECLQLHQSIVNSGYDWKLWHIHFEPVRKNAMKLTKTDLAYMSETTKWTRFTITVRSLSH